MIIAEATPINAHKWAREPNEHYVEEFWCSERLFEEEEFAPNIWDPCCGFGRICISAMKAGIRAFGTDILNRGYDDFGGSHDFLLKERWRSPNIVCNPPFNLVAQFAQRALADPRVLKVAMIFPTARLNAAHWLRETPLIRVWLMTPRPSMPPGHTITAGEKPGGGKVDFCWLVWERGHVGSVEMRWLRRDK
jgi:hypothetical protein